MALRAARRPTPRESVSPHIEIEIARQVLFVVDGQGTVTRILPVSTGKDSVYTEGGQRGVARAPRGQFTAYRKIMGWRRSRLGLLYYPSYITGGIAIHGNPSVPATPASHGCIGIPMFAAQQFSELIAPVGTTVIVYD